MTSPLIPQFLQNKVGFGSSGWSSGGSSGGLGFNQNPNPVPLNMNTVNTSPGQYPEVFGSKVEPITPADPYGDLSKIYPDLAGTNSKISGVINSELSGQLPQDVIDQIQNNSAAYGVSSGMPGSGLQSNRTARDLGLTSLDLIQKGMTNYNQTIPTMSQTQTLSPALQYETSLQNALDKAAPDPSSAAGYENQVMAQYYNQLGGKPASPAAGTIRTTPTTTPIYRPPASSPWGIPS